MGMNFKRKRFTTTSAPVMRRDFLRINANVDVPNVAAGGQQVNTITAPGAEVGDIVQIGYLATPPVSLFQQAWVSAANEISMRSTNLTAGALNPAAADYSFTVLKQF